MDAERVQLFDEIPRVEGERVLLRPLEDGDADALAELTGNPNVYLHEPTFLFERQFDDMHEAIAQVYGPLFTEKQSLILAISLAGEEQMCGLAEFYGLRRPAHKISVGYRLLERYWGRGIATQTLALMLEYLFERTDILLVTASTLPGNGGSARVLQKNGFTLTVQSSPEDWGFEEWLPTDKWRLTEDDYHRNRD